MVWYKKWLLFPRCVLPVDSLEISENLPFLRFFSLRLSLKLSTTEVWVIFGKCFFCQLFEVPAHLHCSGLNCCSLRYQIPRSSIFGYTEKHIKHDEMSSSQKPCTRTLHTHLSPSTVASKRSYCFSFLDKEQLARQISMGDVAKQVERKLAELIQARLWTLLHKKVWRNNQKIVKWLKIHLKILCAGSWFRNTKAVSRLFMACRYIYVCKPLEWRFIGGHGWSPWLIVWGTHREDPPLGRADQRSPFVYLNI